MVRGVRKEGKRRKQTLAIGKAVGTLAAVGAVAKVLAADLADEVVRVPRHAKRVQHAVLDRLAARRANRKRAHCLLFVKKKLKKRERKKTRSQSLKRKHNRFCK